MWARPPPPPPSGPQRHYSGYPPPPGDGRGAVRPIGRPVHAGAPPPPQYYHPGTHPTMYYPSYPFAGPGQWAPQPQALANTSATMSRKRPAPPSDDRPRPPPALRHHGHDVPSQYSPAYHYPMVPWTGPVGPAPCSLKVKPPKPRPSWPCLRSDMPKDTPPPSPVLLTLAVTPPRQQPSAQMYLPAPRLPSVSEHLSSSSSRFPSALPPPDSRATASRSSSSPTLSKIRSPTRPAPRSAPIVIDLTQSPSPPPYVPHSKTPTVLPASPVARAAVPAPPRERILPVLLPDPTPSSSAPVPPIRKPSSQQLADPGAKPPSSISVTTTERPSSALAPTTLSPTTDTAPSSVPPPVSATIRSSPSPSADQPLPQTPVLAATDSPHTSPSSGSPVVVRLSPEPRRKRARPSESSSVSKSSDEDEEDWSEPESKSASPTRPKKRRRGAAPYDPDNRCSYCNKTFSRPDNLKRHIRIHTGERPWPCLEPGCNKSFVDSGDRDKHARIHTGAKPYKCPQCSKTFSDSSALRRHKRDPRSDLACRED